MKLIRLLQLNPRVSTTVIWLAAVLILVFYLLAQRYHVNMPSPLFFISIALIATSIIYQIFVLNPSRGFAGIILLEITVASIIFHYIYHIPTYGLYGSDAYYDLASMKSILESGHIRGVPDYDQITSYFPIIHVLGAAITSITGIDELMVAKWFPSLIASATIPMMYLLVRHLFKKERAALLAALMYTTLQHYILFGSLFVRETVAIILAISCVYFYVTAWSSKNTLVYRVLALICLGGTILAHHLTSIMLILLLALYWAFSSFAKSATGRRLLHNLTGERIGLSLLLMAVIGTLTYWITTVVEPVQVLSFFVQNIFTPSEWGMRTVLQQETIGVIEIPTLRYFFLIYGSYVIYLVFGVMLLYKSASRKGANYIETPVFTMYLLICGVVGIMSFYLLPPTVGGDRFLAFGWLFAFGPLALAIVEFKHRLIAPIALVFVFFFIFVNMYTIHPTLWNYREEGAGGSASAEDFALARSVDFSGGSILGYMNNIWTIYEEQNEEGTDAYFLIDPIDITDYEWIVINRESLEEEGLYSTYTEEVISEMESLLAGGSKNYNIVYESQNLSALQRRNVQ